MARKGMVFLFALMIPAGVLAGCTEGDTQDEGPRQEVAGPAEVGDEVDDAAVDDGADVEAEVQDESPQGPSLAFVEGPTGYVLDYESEFQDDRYVVVGIVENDGDTPIASHSEIAVTFRDVAGKVVGSAWDFLNADLNAGDRWAFAVKSPYDMNRDPHEVAEFEVTLDPSGSSFADPAPAGSLTLLSDNPEDLGDDGYRILGELQNDGDRRVESVRTAAVLWDADGNLLDATTAFTNPSDIDAGNRGSFQLEFERTGIKVEEYDVYLAGST